MSQESDGQDQSSGLLVTQRANRPKNKAWYLAAIIVFLIIVGSVFAYYSGYFESDDGQIESPNNSLVQNENLSEQPEQNETTQERKVYYSSNKNLYSINPVNKETTVVDSSISLGGGALGYGSDTPMTSYDMYKVAYIKNNSIWLKEDGYNEEKIDQVVPNKTAGYYHTYLSGWSSDSNIFVYAISFDCGMGEGTCDENDEDKDATGFYYYDLNTKKSAKLPIKRFDALLPGSRKVVYFELVGSFYSMKSYDINTGQTEIMVNGGWKDYSPQVAFSRDGKKMIYSAGETGNSSYSKIVSADINNSNLVVLKQGAWSEYQRPSFISTGTNDYLYVYSESSSCADSQGICPRASLHSVISGVDTKISEIIARQIGFTIDGHAVVLKGNVYDENRKRTISLIDLKKNTITDLVEGDDSIELRIGI